MKATTTNQHVYAHLEDRARTAAALYDEAAAAPHGPQYRGTIDTAHMCELEAIQAARQLFPHIPAYEAQCIALAMIATARTNA